ncbi:MAG: hypothetical protein OHK0040_02400 [bacterium]
MSNPIVIIGSGFSGLSAAFHCAEAGHKVVVIERKEELGGYFRELKRQFPTNSCGVCFMHPSYPSYCPHIEGERHPNIETMTSTGVVEVKRSVDEIRLKLKTAEGVREVLASSLVFATGFEIFDIAKKPEYGGGVYKNVISALDMERNIYEYAANREVPPFEKIAYVQCAGSRDLKLGRPYCSSFCCMFAIKQALLLKELNEKIDITIFYMDIRAFGKDYERYYLDAKEKGIKFVRSAVATVRKRPATGKLELLYTKEGNAAEELFDTVVLSQGTGYDSNTLKLLNGLEISPDFYSEKPFSNREVVGNVYITGTAFEPMDIPDAVIDGAYIASKIVEKSGIENIETEKAMVKLSKVKKVGFISYKLPEEYTAVLREHFPQVISLNESEKIRFYVEEEKIDSIIVVTDDIRKFEMTAKESNYFGLHINSVFIVPANKADTVKEIESAYYRIKNVKKQPYQVKLLNQRVLVIGGGLAGLTATRRLNRLGFDVILVEKELSLGGRALKLNDRKEAVQKLIEDIEKEGKTLILKGFEIKDLTGRFGDFSCLLESAEEKREVKVGALLFATGGTERRNIFTFEDNKTVITAFDFEEYLERILSYERVVMLQCAGSRNKENPICYRACCYKAVKNALKLKKEKPEIEVYILHRDIRTYGFSENLYREARRCGVKFVRFEEEPDIKKQGDKVNILVKEEGTSLTFSIDADCLILSTGINPNTDNISVNLPKELGFLTPYNKKSGVLDIGKGIFAAGLCLAPNYSEDVIKQAEAVALRIALKLSKRQLVTRFETAFVNERYCCGCELCVTACPVSARHIDKERKIALVDETLCEGCGTCAMVCANKASQHKLFEHKSMLRTIDVMLS